MRYRVNGPLCTLWEVDGITERYDLFVGQKIGRWLIIGDAIPDSDREKEWKCRCDCGTVRYVRGRSLRYGGSKSCGCFLKEQAEKAITISDIEGKTFGELTVLHKAEYQRKKQRYMPDVPMLLRCIV